MAFSASNAALEGFRLTRAHPGAVALWTVVSLVFNFAVVLALVTLSGPALTELMRISEAGPSGDPAAMMPLLGDVMRGYAVMLPLMLLFVTVLANAIYRASARPGESAFGYLRLGVAELRLLVVSFVLAVIGFIGVMLLSIILGIVGGLVSSALGGPQSPGGMLAMLAIVYIGLLAASLVFYVKFSFAGPMTLLQGRINIFGSWKATAGRFWSLTGCYLLAMILGVVVALLGMAIGLAVMMAFGGDINALTKPDMSSLTDYMSPGMIAYMIIASVFNTLTYAIFFAPAMAAYQAIHGGEEDAVRTFD